MKNVVEIIVIWGFLIVALGFLSHTSSVGKNPIVRPRLERLEPFQNATKIDPEGQTDTTNTLAPADASLNKLRQPYALLQDVLDTYDGPTSTSPTSKTCYEADFQKRLERTGNFRQLTNNYKRGVPDSCSSPNHDLLLSTYKVEPLPAA